jgi:ribosomal protein L29
MSAEELERYLKARNLEYLRPRTSNSSDEMRDTALLRLDYNKIAFWKLM